MRTGSLLLALLGCKQESDLFERAGHDTWHQVPTDQVDILFVVDDSHSMENEQVALAIGFDSFVSQLEASATDFHLGVINTSFEPTDPDRGVLLGNPPYLTAQDAGYVAEFKSRVQVGISGADKERGLQAAAHALSPAMALGANAGFLRPEAFLLLIFVSDENDCSDDWVLQDEPPQACYNELDRLVPVDEYVLTYRGLKDDPAKLFTGVIVGPEIADGCLDSVPGFRFLDLAALTGGLVGDICEADWSGMMGELGIEATGIRSSFQLSDAAKEDTLEVFVDDVPVVESGSNGWTYNESTLYLTFHGDAVPARGSTIDATYTIQSGG